MSRVILAASLAVASAITLSAQQSRPDLSGRWTLAPELGTPANTHAFGTTLVVNQSADTVTLEERVVNIQFGTDPSGSRSGISETGAVWRASYVADGADHDVPIQATTPAPPAHARLVMTSTLQAKSYRAVWTGRQLVIMIRDSFALSRVNGESTTIRRTIRQALTLNADGSLIGESLIVADPVAGSEQPAPLPVRSVYRRQ